MLSLPRIYPIVDTATLERHAFPALHAAEAFLEGGAKILQYRHKAHWTRDTFEEAQLIAGLCREAGATLILNDRADYAALLNAGLHVGQEDLPPLAARAVLPPGSIVGFSTHSPAQMAVAQIEPIDYVAFGPVFPTASKHRPDPTVGLKTLRQVRVMTALPLVAIGGITLENAASLFDAGADSVALIAALVPESCTKQSLRTSMSDWLALP